MPDTMSKIVKSADDCPDWAECGECQRAMCADCMETEGKRCVVCNEKSNATNGANVEPAMCHSCEERCDKCDIAIYRKCKTEHEANCNSRTRAKRALATAKEELEVAEVELDQAEKRVAELEQQLRAAKRSKREAEEEVQTAARKARNRAQAQRR